MNVTFEKQAKTLVDNIIQSRKEEKDDCCGQNHTIVRLTLKRVEASYQMHPHSSDAHMALFIANYCAELAYLIRDGLSHQGKDLMKELNDLLVQSSKYLKVQKHEPCLC